MNAPRRVGFRLLILFGAIALFLQSFWLLSAQFARSPLDRLPTDVTAAIGAAELRDRAASAASLGTLRGNLWAYDAYTYATLLFRETTPRAGADLVRDLTEARAALDHALEYAPHQSSAWLFLAGLAARYPSLGPSAKEALKMSFFTGPSEQDLMPLRLRIAAETDSFSDDEIQPLVRRDLRLLHAQRQDMAIADAYDAASPAGKRLIEEAVGELNPSLAKSLPGRLKKPPLPD
jgi:hypothetical protein